MSSDRPLQALAAMPELKRGLWRHYKGGTYRVLGVVRHSETLEPMVLYKPDPPAQARVRLILPHESGWFMMELMDRPEYPATLGKYRFPGGGVNPGETLKEAAIREAREEFGANLQESWMVYVGTPDGAPEGEHHFLVPDHGVQRGTYPDAGEKGVFITLTDRPAYGDRFMGADLRTLKIPDPAHVAGDAWVRPLSMWEDLVEKTNTPVRRFTFVRD